MIDSKNKKQNSKPETQNPKIIFQIWNYELRITDWQIALVLGIAGFLLYLRTLAPDVVDADGGEFQFAAWNFSFVHPTGYPLYLILGGIFQHLVPLGNPAYRLNLFTALTAALAIGACYFAAQELTRQRFAAMVATASFALTRTFWYDASAAETYDLNAFFIALLMYIALRWRAEPAAKKLAAFCFVYGLALTHHRTVILWLPGFALFFAYGIWQIANSKGRRAYGKTRQKKSVSRITFYVLRFAFAFLLPLALYLYIPLRAPVSPYATLAVAPGHDLVLYDNSLTGFINYFLGRVFQNEISWDAVSVTRLMAVPQLLLDQFGALGVALGVVGFIVMLWRQAWANFALVFSGLLATVLFASLYHIGDIFHYYIPADLMWALWIGIAIAAAIEIIQYSKSKIQDPKRAAQITNYKLGLVGLIALGSLTAQFAFNFAAADRSNETQEREQWTRILSAPIPQNTILISDNRDEMMPMWYMQYVENVRRDVVGLFPRITPAPQDANIARLTDSVLDAGRPVFFVRPMDGIEIKYRLAPADPLVRVLGRATDAPPQIASDVVLAKRVRVVGYDAAFQSGAWRVAIYWQPRAKLEQNYTTFVHLLDANGNKVAQGNDHQVGGEFYPTSMWEVGETLRDEQVIALPSNLAPGKYRLLVGMYRASDGEMLGEPVEIGGVVFP